MRYIAREFGISIFPSGIVIMMVALFLVSFQSPLIGKPDGHSQQRYIVYLERQAGEHGIQGLKHGGRPSAAQEAKRSIDAFLGSLRAFRMDLSSKLIWKSQLTPALSLLLNSDELSLVRKQRGVVRVYPEHVARIFLATAVQAIRAPDAWSIGAAGNGQTVAVLDTGVDRTEVRLKDRIIDEACFSSNVPDSGVLSLCPNGGDTQTGDGAAWPLTKRCTDLAPPACDHGTAVAAIAASQLQTGSSLWGSGVAPFANIAAIQVFSLNSDARACQASDQSSPCVAATETDVLRALEYLYLNRARLKLSAINLSLGSGIYGDYCDSEDPAFTNYVNLLAAQKVAVVAATGNVNNISGISWPACIKAVVAVGNLTKSLVPYSEPKGGSNSANILDFWAVGADLNGVPLPNRRIGNHLTGTSFAAPQIAAAIADVESLAPSATLASVLSTLDQFGTQITDPRNNIIKPLPNLFLSALSASGRGYIAVSSVGLNFVSLEPETLPPDQKFQLTNPGRAAVDWRLKTDAAFINLSGHSGTLQPGQSMEITVGISRALLTKPRYGTRPATIYVGSPSGASIVHDGQRASGIAASFSAGSAETDIELSDTNVEFDYATRLKRLDKPVGYAEINGSVTNNSIDTVPATRVCSKSDQDWLPTWTDCRTLSQNDSEPVLIVPRSPESLSPGDHTAHVIFTAQKLGTPLPGPVIAKTMTVILHSWSDLSPLSIFPTGNAGRYVVGGPVGGPYSPAYKDYLVSNPTDDMATIEVTGDRYDWFDVSPSPTVIPGHQSATIRITADAAKISQLPLSWNDNVLFRRVGRYKTGTTIPVWRELEPHLATNIYPASDTVFGVAESSSDYYSSASLVVLDNIGTQWLYPVVASKPYWLNATVMPASGGINIQRSGFLKLELDRAHFNATPPGQEKEEVKLVDQSTGMLLANIPVTLFVKPSLEPVQVTPITNETRAIKFDQASSSFSFQYQLSTGSLTPQSVSVSSDDNRVRFAASDFVVSRGAPVQVTAKIDKIPGQILIGRNTFDVKFINHTVGEGEQHRILRINVGPFADSLLGLNIYPTNSATRIVRPDEGPIVAVPFLMDNEGNDLQMVAAYSNSPWLTMIWSEPFWGQYVVKPHTSLSLYMLLDLRNLPKSYPRQWKDVVTFQTRGAITRREIEFIRQ